jgi:hypothetical protein
MSNEWGLNLEGAALEVPVAKATIFYLPVEFVNFRATLAARDLMGEDLGALFPGYQPDRNKYLGLRAVPIFDGSVSVMAVVEGNVIGDHDQIGQNRAYDPTGRVLSLVNIHPEPANISFAGCGPLANSDGRIRGIPGYNLISELEALLSGQLVMRLVKRQEKYSIHYGL